MRTFCLGTGSSGNSFYVESENKTKVLVDCGLSYTKTKELLEEKGIDIKEIKAIFITHEHSDHILSLKSFLKNQKQTTIYISSGTKKALKFEDENFNIVKHHSNIKIEDMQIFVLNKSHDTSEALSYIFNDSREKIGVFTDLGHVDSETNHILKTLDTIYFEANYCDDIIKEKREMFYGDYITRLTSNKGHLSIEQSCEALLNFVSNEQKIVISHISQNTNTYENTYRKIKEKLNQNNLFPKLFVGFQGEPTEWIE